MKSLLTFVVLSLLVSNSFALTVYRGKTTKGADCGIAIMPDSRTIGFAGGDLAFGFPASSEDLGQALRGSKFPLYLAAVQGSLATNLALGFDQTGRPSQAIYSQRSAFFPQTVKCLELKIVR